MQLVTDVQQATTLTHQLFQNDKQLVDRLRCENGSWLIQNKQLGLREQSTDYFNPLHLAHTQGVHRP